MASTFNPFDLDKPVLNLGEHGTFTLSDITESMSKKLANLGERIQQLQDAEEADSKPFVALVGELAETACEQSEGLAATIVELYESEQIGAKALLGLAQFINEWIVGEETAGEG